MFKKLAMLSALFLLFSAMPTFAYLPIDYSKEVQLITNFRDINCVNDTSDNKTYCGVVAQGGISESNLYLLNYTFDIIKTCPINSKTDDTATICLVNKSFAYVFDSNSQKVFLFNLSSCDYVSNFSTALPFATYGCDFNTALRYLVFSKNYVYDENGNLVYNSGYDFNDFDLYTNTNYNTFYIRENNPNKYILKKYTDSTNTLIINLSSTYGISSISDEISFSIASFKGSLRNLFFVYRGSTSSKWIFNRANLTLAENNLSSQIENPLFLNNSVKKVVDCFKIDLTTNLNGTLQFFVNGTSVKNETISNAPIIDNEYSYCYELEGGNYIFKADFIDTNGMTWTTGNIFITIRDNSISALVSNAIGSFFGLESDSSLNIMALISSISISIFVAIKIQQDAGKIFIGTMLTTLVVFWFVGWLDTSVMIPIFVGLGLLLAFTMGKIFTGN